MKLCFSTLTCPAWSLRQILEAAAGARIGGVDFRGIGPDIDITRLPAFIEQLDSTLALLREFGVQMPCLNTSVTLVCPSPERWQMMLEEAQRYGQLAERTGTPFLRVFGGAVPRGMSRDEARNIALRHLRQLVKICRHHGCRPLLETHDAWSTGAQAMELIGEFEPREAGVLWDIEHSYRNGETLEMTVKLLGPHLAHVHVKDSVRIQEKNQPRLLGEGELPVEAALNTLKNAGYDGWICLEVEKRWHAEAPEPEVSIPQFAAYMRQAAGSRQ